MILGHRFENQPDIRCFGSKTEIIPIRNIAMASWIKPTVIAIVLKCVSMWR